MSTRRFTGHVIRNHRKALGLTMKDVAEHLGHSIQFQSLIETGQRDMPIEKVSQTCLLLNISPQKINQALVRSACERMRARL